MNWGRRLLFDTSAGKTELVKFYLVGVHGKMYGSVLEEKLSFKI